MNLRLLALAATALLTASSARAAVPLILPMQGRLLDAADRPVEGAVDLTVAIYDVFDDQPGQAHAGPRWSARYHVTLSGGLYSLDAGDPANGAAFPADLFDGSFVPWLSVAVGDASELRPRMRIGRYPFAQAAASAVLAHQAESLTAEGAAALDARFARLLPNATGAAQTGHLHVSGTATAAAFAGDGASLTGLNASSLASGTLPGDRLSGTYASAISLTNSGNAFTGDGSGLTNLGAAALSSGTIADARFGGSYSQKLTLSNSANLYAGDGAGLTNLNAASVASGALPGGRLAGAYPSALTLTNASNVLAGDGSGLTGLNASALASGSISDGRLAGTYSGALTLSNSTNVFKGDGSALTGVNAATLGGKAVSSFLQTGGSSGLTADLNVGFNQLVGARIESQDVTTHPACDGTRVGHVYLNSFSKALYYCDGTVYRPLNRKGVDLVNATLPITVDSTTGGSPSYVGDHLAFTSAGSWQSYCNQSNGSGGTHWVQVDFGAPTTVTSFGVGGYPGGSHKPAAAWRLEGSADASTWVAVWNGADNSTWSNDQAVATYPPRYVNELQKPARYRYYRVIGETWTNGYMLICDLALYE